MRLLAAAYTLRGLLLRPVGTPLDSGAFTGPDGHQYVVGPALYRVKQVDAQYPSLVRGPLTEDAPNLEPEYVPPEQWPHGVLLDNAVVTETTDVAEVEGSSVQ